MRVGPRPLASTRAATLPLTSPVFFPSPLIQHVPVNFALVPWPVRAVPVMHFRVESPKGLIRVIDLLSKFLVVGVPFKFVFEIHNAEFHRAIIVIRIFWHGADSRARWFA